MREFSQSSQELSGSFLVAHPSLLDPNFRRSVVFMTAHDQEEGSHGLIINRPMGNTVADLLPAGDMGSLADLPVFIGGPVASDQLSFAAFHRELASGNIVCTANLQIEEARELAADKLTSVRAFIGYSGWSRQQLETELAQKAWIIRKPDMDAMDIDQCKQLWPSIMRDLGPWFRLLASAPDDPSRN